MIVSFKMPPPKTAKVRAAAGDLQCSHQFLSATVALIANGNGWMVLRPNEFSDVIYYFIWMYNDL